MLKKLLLVYPSIADNPEIIKGIAIMNGIARRHSWETKYFDACWYEKARARLHAPVHARSDSGELKPVIYGNEEKLKPYADLVTGLQDTIDSFVPDIIAISCTSYEYVHLMEFWSNIRVPSNTIVAIGGVHCILKPNEVIETGFFDLVCTGDGEEAFDELLTKYENGRELCGIQNLYFRNRIDGKITRNSRGKLIDESVVWGLRPDYSIFKDDYFVYPFQGELRRRFRFEVGRGCPFRCTYCANSALQAIHSGEGYTKYFRSRPIETMKDEMKMLLNVYKIEVFLLDDDCLLARPNKWLDDLFDWYGREIKKPFILITRPETVTEKRIELMKKGNAPFLLKIGVESGNEGILENVLHRDTKIAQIIKVHKMLHDHNILTGACFMIGLPYETREDIFRTIHLCRTIKPDEIIVNVFQPMPGQALTDLCVKEGYVEKDAKPNFFTDRSILKMPQISQEEIEGLRRVFSLYALLPEERFKDIELCERDYEHHTELYQELVDLRWRLTRSHPISVA